MKKLFLVLFIFITALQADKKLNIATTIYPIYDAVKIVGVNNIDVKKIISSSQDIHEFSPTPKDVIKIINSDIFLYMGAGLDDFLVRFRDGKLAYNLSKDLMLEDEHHEEHHEEHGHEEHADAHYWLDIDLYIKVVDKISNILSKADKQNSTFYKKRALNYIEELKDLKSSYKSSLSECKRDTIVVNHNAYAYLGEEYNFKIHSLAGSSSHSRASAKNMKQAIEYLKSLKNPIVFGEPFGNSNALKMVASETNSKVKVLETLANITKGQENENYISLMRKNLVLLIKALDCR